MVSTTTQGEQEYAIQNQAIPAQTAKAGESAAETGTSITSAVRTAASLITTLTKSGGIELATFRMTVRRVQSEHYRDPANRDFGRYFICA